MVAEEMRSALRSGVVLCGGHSRRMGRDKAGLRVGGRGLLAHAVATLSAVAPRVVLATGGERRYADLGLPAVLDRVFDGGPLAGLEAGLAEAERAGGGWVALLACDMPRARPEVFEALLARARERGADACLLESPEGLEPLHAVYHTRCLAAVRSALDAGERRMVAFHSGHGPIGVATLRFDELPADLGAAESARNLNTPAELEAELESAR